MWETQTVCVCGVYHWKSMKVQRVKSWTALYFVVRGHPVSLESFIFGRVTQCLWTKNEGPGTDDPFYSRLLLWGLVLILLGKSYLHFFVFSFQEAFKNQNVVGFLGQSQVRLLSVCLICGIWPRTWVDKGRQGLESYNEWFFTHYFCHFFLSLLLNLLQYCLCLMFFGKEACGILALWPEMEPTPLHWKAEPRPLDHQGSPVTVPGVMMDWPTSRLCHSCSQLS